MGDRLTGGRKRRLRTNKELNKTCRWNSLRTVTGKLKISSEEIVLNVWVASSNVR
jgi:hypothetical protein